MTPLVLSHRRHGGVLARSVLRYLAFPPVYTLSHSCWRHSRPSRKNSRATQIRLSGGCGAGREAQAHRPALRCSTDPLPKSLPSRRRAVVVVSAGGGVTRARCSYRTSRTLRLQLPPKIKIGLVGTSATQAQDIANELPNIEFIAFDREQAASRIVSASKNEAAKPVIGMTKFMHYTTDRVLAKGSAKNTCASRAAQPGSGVPLKSCWPQEAW